MATLRATRERDLVSATRALFDERGMQEAPVEEIARSAGIARGLIYRQFSSKEELFVLTVTDYLAELAPLLEAAVSEPGGPVERLERCVEAFAGYCQRYPAFLDCQVALMRRPSRELRELVSESVYLRLGQGMAACLSPLAEVLADGHDAGVFAVEDPKYMSNFLWTQLLGSMHYVRIGVGVSQAAPGVPELFRVDPAEVTRTCAASALATVRAPA
jgi:AcrR family transcriptional regulator